MSLVGTVVFGVTALPKDMPSPTVLIRVPTGSSLIRITRGRFIDKGTLYQVVGEI